jgi:hypothetical protein
MRGLMLLIWAGVSTTAVVAEPTELVTAQDAVLCLRAESLDVAAAHPAADSQDRLRRLGCLRSPAGIPATFLGSEGSLTWSVRYRPQGISGGVQLWGRPSSFVRLEGSAQPALRQQLASP